MRYYLLVLLLGLATFISAQSVDLACSSDEVYMIQYEDSTDYETRHYQSIMQEGLNVTLKFARGKHFKEDDCDLSDIKWMETTRYSNIENEPDLSIRMYLGQFINIYTQRGIDYYTWYNSETKSYTIVGYEEREDAIVNVRVLLPIKAGFECLCTTINYR